MTGSRMGNRETHSGGSVSSVPAVSGSIESCSFSGLISIGLIRSSHEQTANPTRDIGIPTRAPTHIMVPRSIPNSLAMYRGPGVGGTIECVTAPPATTDERNRT